MPHSQREEVIHDKESRKEKQRAQVQSQSLEVGGARNARIQGRQTEIR